MVLRALGMRQHNMATLQRVGRGGAQRGMGQGAAGLLARGVQGQGRLGGSWCSCLVTALLLRPAWAAPCLAAVPHAQHMDD